MTQKTKRICDGCFIKKEPDTFKRFYQTGYYSLMKPKLKEQLEEQTMRQK